MIISRLYLTDISTIKSRTFPQLISLSAKAFKSFKTLPINFNRSLATAPSPDPDTIIDVAKDEHKCFSVVVEEAPATDKKQSKTKKKSSSVANFAKASASVRELNSELGLDVLKLPPPKFLKVNTAIPTTDILIDGGVAKKISELIRVDKPSLDSPLVELSPGFGILTKELLKLGFHQITCFEENPKLQKLLTDKRQFPVHIVPKGFSDFPRLHHVDKADGEGRISQLLSQVKTNPNEKIKGNLLVVGSLPHICHINFIIKSLVTHQIFYEEDLPWIDPVFYVAIGSKAYWVLNSSPESGYFLYRPAAVLFQLLFKTTLLETLPRSAYIPWVNDSGKGKSVKFQSRNNFKKDIVYFVKIENNSDLLKELGRDQLYNFWYFVRQHLFSRKYCVIPQLEGWIPGCGSRLVRKGFTIYSQFGELNPQQILELYKEFISWPEFGQSSFQIAAEKFQHRILEASQE